MKVSRTALANASYRALVELLEGDLSHTNVDSPEIFEEAALLLEMMRTAHFGKRLQIDVIKAAKP